MRSLRVLVIVAVAAAFSAGCGGEDPSAADASPAPDAMVVPDAGNPVARGHGGSGNVAGGVKARSANFKLVGTMGKGDGTASSSNFKHRGGVLGGTQP